MPQQVGQALLQSLQIFLAGLGLGHAAVVLQGPDCGNQDHAVGLQAGHAALDVQELLRAQVGAEAGLGDGVVGQPHGNLGGGDGVAAVGDVGEGAAMYKSRGMFQGLNQVGLQRVLQQGGHSALGLQVAGRDGLAVPGVTHNQPSQAGLQIVDVGGQAQNRHDFGGHRDVVAVLTGVPLALPPRPSTTKRSCRSFISTQRRQVIWRGSRFRALP